MQRFLSFFCPLIKYQVDIFNNGDLLYDVHLRDLSKLFKGTESVDEYGRSRPSKGTYQIICQHLGTVQGKYHIFDSKQLRSPSTPSH
jgi:hypothetical protein